MCEIKLPMKFKVDFGKVYEYRLVFDSLVEKGLVSGFNVDYIISRALEDWCEDRVYYFTINKSRFGSGYNLDRVSKDTYNDLNYNEYGYHQNQWFLHASEIHIDLDKPRYCNGVKLPKPVDGLNKGEIYYYPTPNSSTKSGTIMYDHTVYDTYKSIELLNADMLYDNIEDSDIHSDAMLLTNSSEPKELMIHEHDLTEMKNKIKNDEETN